MEAQPREDPKLNTGGFCLIFPTLFFFSFFFFSSSPLLDSAPLPCPEIEEIGWVCEIHVEMEDSICQSSSVQWDKLAVSAESHRSIANVATPSLRQTVRLGAFFSRFFYVANGGRRVTFGICVRLRLLRRMDKSANLQCTADLGCVATMRDLQCSTTTLYCLPYTVICPESSNQSLLSSRLDPVRYSPVSSVSSQPARQISSAIGMIDSQPCPLTVAGSRFSLTLHNMTRK